MCNDNTAQPRIQSIVEASSRLRLPKRQTRQVMPDDHSKSVPPLPIPNRTVKRFCADDSAETSVKVGYRQAFILRKAPTKVGAFFFSACATQECVSEAKLLRQSSKCSVFWRKNLTDYRNIFIISFLCCWQTKRFGSKRCESDAVESSLKNYSR